MNNILWAVMWFLILGGAFGLILAIAGKIFEVKADERIEMIVDVLPGANCGGCGFTGCGALAEKIVAGEAKINACPVGGEIAANKIAEIMGSVAESSERFRAQVMCCGINNKAKPKYEYLGINDCVSAMRLAGGAKACPNGCLGLGSCIKSCKFDTIEIIDGVAAVNYEKCKACGACASACPKKIIKLIPFKSEYWVGCASNDKGAVTRQYCETGCIACKICEKKCSVGAIKINDFTASIDYSKCTNCGECAKACPRKIIKSKINV